MSLWSGPTVAERSIGRINNFDVIRLVAALAVILSHAYPLSWGDDLHEPFSRLSRGQMTLGALAVDVFFVVSGFLITQSFLRSGDVVVFARSRFLRIIPGLLVSTVATAFVLGPLVTTVPLHEYFSSTETYGYLLTVFLWDAGAHYLPGVFATNVFANVVNGSVWTLAAEALCYVAVGLLGVFQLLRSSVVIPLFAFAIAEPFMHLSVAYPWQSYLEMSRYFAAGMLFYLLRDRIRLNGKTAIAAMGILLAAAVAGRGLNSLAIIFGAYLVVWLALTPSIRLSSVGSHGDFSYGIYIYAFPIQQALVYFAGGSTSPLVNVALAVPLTVACAVASWLLVEKPALALKGRRRPVAIPSLAAAPGSV